MVLAPLILLIKVGFEHLIPLQEGLAQFGGELEVCGERVVQSFNRILTLELLSFRALWSLFIFESYTRNIKNLFSTGS